MATFKSILCPVDFFPASLRAFDYALKLARDAGARVYALHVVSTALPVAYDYPITISDLVSSLEKSSKREMLKLKASAEKLGVRIQAVVRVGIIDTEILSACEKSKADLVVMGTHGHHGIERWFTGSTAERMLRHCPVPL